MNTAATLRYEDIAVGQRVAFSKTFATDDILAFARLTGDFNPLHVDPEYAKSTRFERCVVHGMLLAGLLSRLVGMHLPGQKCLYLSQSLDFAQPVFAGQQLSVQGVVLGKQDAMSTVTIATQIQNEAGVVVVRGKALVQVLI
jgi:acyl dehydratase